MKLYALFSKRGPPKNKGAPRQLPHLPHPISTSGYDVTQKYFLFIFILSLYLSS